MLAQFAGASITERVWQAEFSHPASAERIGRRLGISVTWAGTKARRKKTSNSLVSQTVNNNNSADHKLDTISWLLAALAVAFVITVTYLLWRRCKSSLKGWVVKQQAATNLATVRVLNLLSHST
ncbi:hypothetical protein ACJJTC_016072 [Scirpophaga incertulas]